MSLDSHRIAQMLCRPGARVLDVGCGSGVVAQRFVDIGCSVVGLDIEQSAVEAMAGRGLEAHVIDLDNDDLESSIGEALFDVIVCLDVLEHTKKPKQVLAHLLEHLRPEGDVIVSLPNVTHGDVRLSLLGGQFTYRDEGLLDATHLRFFDKASVDDLIHSVGLEIRELEPVIMEIGQTELGIDAADVSAELLEELRSDVQSNVYQWVFRASRDGAKSEVPPFVPLLGELAALRVALQAAEAYAAKLAGELEDHSVSQQQAAEHIASLGSQLEDRDRYVAEVEERIGDITVEAAEEKRILLAGTEQSEEDLKFLTQELAAKIDVAELISSENSHLLGQVEGLRSAAERMSADLQAVRARRLYRILDRVSRLPGASLFARRS